ncbi:TlpA family protein disulfide reductase [Paenibacillus sp. 481]|uniref:TlpA family protein disulfide reductase n=1 Tax=Paenibacillus sp. 481 TaxID=2835869 RepID=UPI001E2DB60D|nr:TlpA disulfide reductase family protein [Paenibacillus sp. 481]UHA73256.1 TlpA family protein disulfide reductase [Paenibacillus sp. 481]
MKKIVSASTYFILILAVCTILFIIGNQMLIPSESDKQPINTAITLKDVAAVNHTIQFSEKPTVLQVFTSWCPYCNDDAPKIVSLHEQYKDKVNIYGINLIQRDEMDAVKDFIRNYKIKYPVLLDEEGKVHKLLGGTGFPALFFFNSQGEIVDQIIGSSEMEYIEQSFSQFITNYE